MVNLRSLNAGNENDAFRARHQPVPISGVVQEPRSPRCKSAI